MGHIRRAGARVQAVRRSDIAADASRRLGVVARLVIRQDFKTLEDDLHQGDPLVLVQLAAFVAVQEGGGVGYPPGAT